MKKKAFQNDLVTQTTTNGYVINAFSYQQHDPNNENTASVTVVYSLASFDKDGHATASAVPGQFNVTLMVFNVGDDRRLRNWLAGNGTPGDPLRFDYHDVERLIEVDIQTRFGVQLNKK